jgi:hypothetical protein
MSFDKIELCRAWGDPIRHDDAALFTFFFDSDTFSYWDDPFQ